MHLFYSPNIQGNTHQLDEPESKHAIRVLRLEKGDRVVLVDGLGGWYEALIDEDHPKRCVLKIQNSVFNYQQMDYSLHLAVSPTKNMERLEWFLEKATEIGISEITPLLCQRTERKQVKMDRLERILVSAMKQSLKAYKPILHEPVNYEDFVSGEHRGSLGIAYCKGENREGIEMLDAMGPYTLMVGPEGDFTREEVELALGRGFKPFSLGESRLRTETAAVFITAALSILHRKGD